MHFTEVHNVFDFQKLLLQKSYMLIRFHKIKSFLWNKEYWEMM